MGWSRILLWTVLTVPAAVMVFRYASGAALAMDLYHPSGEMSVRLMILALLPGPLVEVFGPNTFLRSWLAVRRNFGVAAFLYAALHLIFYVIDMRLVSAMIRELTIPGISTGWLAIFALAVPAAISTDRAMQRLGRRWKQMQRLVYPAILLALVHWLLLDWAWGPALVHLTPLLIVWVLRFVIGDRKELSRIKK